MRLLGLVRLLIAILPALAVLPAAARADNPFGVMLFPNPGEGLDLMLARARGLGIDWFRPPTISIEDWPGDGACPACGAYFKSGLRLAIAVRATGEASESAPSRPPANLDAFSKTLASAIAAWHPAFVAVEGSENDPRLYKAPGDLVAAYGAELSAACAVAHAAKAACANGGLTGISAAALLWWAALADGDADRACEFAQRALPGRELCAYRKAAEVPAQVKAQLIGSADRLLALYRSAPIDTVNFHWFGTDARAFAETADYLAKVTGKPVVSNEIGLRRGADDPALVRPLLRAARAEGLRLAIWYSLDTADTVSLFGRDGRLRPTGWEFQRQLSGLR